MPSFVLPDDARQRKKSADPTSQHPSYLQAIREWLLRILAYTNEPVYTLINPVVVRTIVEKNGSRLPDDMTASMCERIIQLNSWLNEYHQGSNPIARLYDAA